MLKLSLIEYLKLKANKKWFQIETNQNRKVSSLLELKHLHQELNIINHPWKFHRISLKLLNASSIIKNRFPHTKCQKIWPKWIWILQQLISLRFFIRLFLKLLQIKQSNMHFMNWKSRFKRKEQSKMVNTFLEFKDAIFWNKEI